MQLTLLFACLFSFGMVAQNSSFTQVELLEDQESSIQMKFSTSGYLAKTVQTADGPAQIISVEEGTPMLKAGAPDLPKLTTSIVIGDETNTAITVVSSLYTDYENVEVAPSKGNLLRDVNPADIAFQYGPAYTQNAFYPSELAYVRNPYILRDFRGQTVVVNPVQYNPVTKVLRVYDEIVVEVKEIPGNPVNPLYRETASVKVTKGYQPVYENRFLNFGEQTDRYEQVSELGNMLIICADEFAHMMDEFVEWKNRKGIPTSMVTMSEIGSDAPSAVMDYISTYYQDNGITFLLIVGDENMVPTQQTSSNNACDHCYSYQAGNDHYADFLVGRFNAETEDHLLTMIDRTYRYERTPNTDINPDWFQNGLGLGSNEGPGDDGEYDFEHLNNLKIELLDYGFNDVWEFYDGSNGGDSPTPGDITSDGNGSPNTNNIVSAVNEGLTIFNYTGHGDHAVLASGGFDNDAINDLTNVDMYPFLVAVACCVGDFQNDFGSGPCLGDAWIRATDATTGAPTGGIGGAFSSILQSWAPPMEGQDEMVKLITETVGYEHRHTSGGVVAHGNGSMIDAYGGGGEEMADTWNIFGDPSVQLWGATPETMTVSHVAAVNVGTSQLTVTCDVDGAMIGLYYDGALLGTAIADGGVASFDFEPVTNPDLIYVTATAHNHLPYEGEVLVIVGQGPYVVLNDFEINDASGNANAQADYAESVMLDVNLANVGVELAPGVTATLSTTDVNVTITDDAADWGDMANNTDQTQVAAYAFDVNAYIDNDHTVLFDLSIESDGNTWMGTIPVTLYAPVIKAEPTVMVDDVAGGNGNGRLESGEIAEVRISNLNEGGVISEEAIAALITANPNLTIQNGSLNVGAIGTSDIADATFTVEVSSDAPTSFGADFDYTVDAGLYGDAFSFTLMVNQIVEDFESNDFTTFEWEQEGAAPWFISSNQPYSGDVCSESGDISDDQLTAMAMSVNVLEPGEISFSRRVSSEGSYDFLYFYINGQQQAEWSGELPWEEMSYAVNAGPAVFSWVYQKDFIVSSGQDAAWVDEIILPLIEVEEEPVDTTINSTFDLVQGFDLAVHPNPVQKVATLTFELEQAGTVGVQLINLHGQVLDTWMEATDLNAGTYAKGFAVDRLPAGTYLISLTVDGQRVTRTLVKQ